MARPHRGEMTVVQRGELRLAEALDDREDRAVNEADIQVGIGPQQLVDALVVCGEKVLDDQRTASNLIERRDERSLRRVGAEQMVDLDEDRGGNDPPLACGLAEQLCAAFVRVVVSIERADQNRGVEDQRDGRGSKTSSLASLLRSPRPELKAPMQVSGGCSPSSVASGVSRIGVPLNSCSSASRRSWGTATPRSRAARCARSMRSASISTLVFCVAAIVNRVASAPTVGTRPGTANELAPNACSEFSRGWAVGASEEAAGHEAGERRCGAKGLASRAAGVCTRCGPGRFALVLCPGVHEPGRLLLGGERPFLHRRDKPCARVPMRAGCVAPLSCGAVKTFHLDPIVGDQATAVVEAVDKLLHEGKPVVVTIAEVQERLSAPDRGPERKGIVQVDREGPA